MARDYFINGETMVYAKGPSGTNIATSQELGLADGPIRLTLLGNHDDLTVDAWARTPTDIQWKLGEVQISMNLVYIDRDILKTCIRCAQGGATTYGTQNRAGVRLGNNLPRFNAGNYLIELNLASPQGSEPWRFYTTYLTSPLLDTQLGVDRSPFNLRWRAFAYPGAAGSNPGDPWQGGVGAAGAIIWDNTLTQPGS